MLDRDEDDSLEPLTPDTLMLKGANKYKTLKQNGKWKEPSQVEQELLAMSTEIAKLKKESSNHKQRYNSREKKRISSVIPGKVWS